jgi:hypothetical protein
MTTTARTAKPANVEANGISRNAAAWMSSIAGKTVRRPTRSETCMRLAGGRATPRGVFMR